MGRKIQNCDIDSVNQQKVQCDERQYSEAHLHNKLESPIFKLNVDCLNKIFDYLSFEDVHSIGETCKPMLQIAGEYFQANHVTEAYVDYRDITYPGSYTQVKEFNKFQQNLLFSTVYPSRSLKKITWYVGKNYSQEFKRMRFYEADLTGKEIQNLWHKFEKVESVTIERCMVTRKFYKQFPKLCKNLRRLYIEDFECRRDALRQVPGFEWLLWTYPKLDHFHWIKTKNWQRTNEFKLFFERNPQVRSFAIDANSLWANRSLLSKIKLDDLTIELGRVYNSDEHEPRNVQHIYDLLKEFHEKGVYKRLLFNLKCFSQRTLDEMPPLDALKSLCFCIHNVGREDVTLPNWMNLTELKVSFYCHLANCESLARQLVNLRRIYLYYVKLSDLMQFVRYSVHLTKVKVKCFEDFDNDSDSNILDVAALNKEREKLNGAKRMVIHIEEEIYLPTKWSLNGKEYSLIEIRRVSADEWGHQFIPWY